MVVTNPSSNKVVADLDVSKIQFILGTAEKTILKLFKKQMG